MNEQFESYEWNAYLINASSEALEMALIVSRGFDKKKETVKLVMGEKLNDNYKLIRKLGRQKTKLEKIIGKLVFYLLILYVMTKICNIQVDVVYD